MTGDSLWLVSLGTYVIVGAPLLLHPEFRRFSLPGRSLLAGAAGGVVVSWVMTVFALVSIRWSALGVLAAATSLSFCLRSILGRSVARIPTSSVGPLSLTGLLALVLGAGAVLLAVLATRAGGATSPDLLLFWGPKALRFAGAHTVDVGFLADPLLDHLHPDYPPLLTNAYALATLITGHFSWWGAVAVFPLLLGATGIAIGSILASDGPREWAWVHASIATCSLGLVGVHAMIGGVAEMPLLFFEMLAMSLLLLRPPATDGNLLLAGLCLAGAACTKVEGLPFALAASCLFAVTANASPRRLRALAFLIGPTAVTLGTWFLFGGTKGLFWFYKPYGSLLAIRWERIPVVVEETLRAIWQIDYGLPFLLPLLLFALAPRKPRAVAIPVGVAAALICFLMATYLSGEADLRQWIGWSAARVLIPVPGLFALAAFKSESSRLDTVPLSTPLA